MSLQRYCTTLFLGKQGEISPIYFRVIRPAEEVVHGAAQAICQLRKVVRLWHGCAHHCHHVVCYICEPPGGACTRGGARGGYYGLPRARCALAMTELESFPCHSEPVHTLVWESVFPWKAGRERSAVLPRPGGLKWLSCFL